MEYPLWLFFTVWFVSSAIASEEWVQVPIIGHRPKGASERTAQQSPRISAVQVPLSTRAPTTTTRAPFRPAKVSYRVPPWSTIAPSTSTRAPSPPTRAPSTSTRAPSTKTRPPPQKVDVPENLSLPELRIEPGLPADEFMRAHETLSRYSKGSVGEKLSFLGHLKKQLLRKTAELMPRAIIALGGRSLAPSAEVQGRGHKGIGFPSSEGTLMSLAFLVFAVFLVKVVIQLVQGLQSNSYGAVITSTTTRTSGGSRSRSNWDKAHTEEELLRLLESLQHQKRVWAQP